MFGGMYKCPTFEIAAPSSRRSQLVLIPARGAVPPAVLKLIPVQLRDHSAVKGDRGARLVLHSNTASTVIFGIGKQKDFTPQEAAEWGENAGHLLNKEHLSEIHVVFPEGMRDADVCANFLKGLSMANFTVDELKSKGETKRPELKKVCISADAPLDKAALQNIPHLAQGLAFARTLIELPPSHANPSQIVARFQQAVAKGLVEIEVWDEKKIDKEGMGLLKAVSAGSATPPRFLIARYGKDMAKTKPQLFLVGKGVTFDTGGINLKTTSWQDLLAMKRDMSGAAAVMGAMLAISQMRIQQPVTMLAPLTVNAIDANATLPGDVITSYSGKTVEIMNTDAEGRLILGDAMHYAVKNKADYIVDVATLTGACMMALGKHLSGLFTNSDSWGEEVQAAAEASGEPVWKMPMSPRYGEELKSKVADFANMGKSREGGAQLGAKFIERFVEGVSWVHLDIAGTDCLGEPAASVASQPGAGRMVHTLVQLAAQMAEKHSGGSKAQSGKKKS